MSKGNSPATNQVFRYSMTIPMRMGLPLGFCMQDLWTHQHRPNSLLDKLYQLLSLFQQPCSVHDSTQFISFS